MTSRERVLASINHKAPDRVPVDIGGTPSSGISAIAYNKLIDYCGFADKTNNIYDVVQQVTQPSQEFIDRFHIDVLDVGRTFNTSPQDWCETTLANGTKANYPKWFRPQQQSNGAYLAYDEDGDVLAKMPMGATFFDQTYFPYIDGYPDDFSGLDTAMNKVLWSKFVHSPWDNANDINFWGELREKAVNLRNSTDKAIIIVCGCNLFEWGTFLRRIDNFLVDLLLEPENVERVVGELMQRHLATLEKVCGAVGDVVDIIRFGDDLGTDNATFMSPELYRKIFKPNHKKLCEYVHENSGMKTFLHSCGNIYPLIGDLIEAGYDIINPVQTTLKGMEAERLKKEFGRDITFWGAGCDTRSILNNASPQMVKEHTKRNIDILIKDGGFVFSAIHNIMPDVPPENIVAMFEAIEEVNR